VVEKGVDGEEGIATEGAMNTVNTVKHDMLIEVEKGWIN